MAKKKIQAAEIVITTTDGGSFKVTGKEAKRLAKEMGALGGASQATDRRIKGVTGQSANASKNFSKQAQTMQGGIVAVYATIAAQIFAVSAAFQFLKSSFETRNLIEGQQQFGAVTGVAYQTITRNVQEATGNMLQFKEAASGVAIGIAAGLSAGSLERLGEAAKNASLALGRDVTDSYNRLIKGVTKAEPELLDELGIVLRLENATNKYAAAIGKSREQLNAYERTQAVLNDVLEQAETKYRIIGQVMDPDAFALGQLTKEIDELMMKFQVFVAEGLMPIISFFKDNALALVAAMGLFVMPIIKSLLPDLSKGMENAARRSEQATTRMKDSFLEAKDAMTASKLVTQDPVGTRKKSAAGLRDLGVKSFKGGEDQLNARQIAAYKRHMRDKTGIYKKFNMTERAAFRKHLLQQEAALRASTGKQVGIVSKGEYQKQALAKMTTAVVAGGEKIKQAAMAATAKWGMRLMSMMGWLGMIAMIVQGVISLWNSFRDLDEEEKRLREETKKVTESLTTLNEELERMGNVRATAGLLTLGMSLSQIGNALQSTDLVKQIRAYNKEVDKGNKADTDVMKGFRKMAYDLAVLNPQFIELYNEMKDGNAISATAAKKWEVLASGMINAANAAQRFSQNQESLTKSIQAAVGKFAKMPFQELGKNIKASMEDIRSEIGLMGDDYAGAVMTNFGQIAGGKDGEMHQMLETFAITQGKGLRSFSSEFGLLAEAKVKEQDRARQELLAFDKFLEQGTQTTLGGDDLTMAQRTFGNAAALRKNKKSTGLIAGTGASRRIKTKAEIADELGLSKLTDTQIEIYDEYMKNHGRLLEEQELISKGEAEDVEGMKRKLEVLREQLNVYDEIKALQNFGRRLQQATADNKLQLAKNKGLTLEEKKKTQIALAEQSNLKVTKAQSDIMTANVGIRTAEEKLRTSLLNNEKQLAKVLEAENLTAQELTVIDKDRLSKILERHNITSEELDNMKTAKGVAGVLLEAQEELTELEYEKLGVQYQALANSQQIAKFTQLAAQAARDYKNALRDAARELKLGGGSGSAKAANRTTKMGLLGGVGQEYGKAGFGVGATGGGEIGRLGAQAEEYATMAAGVRKVIGEIKEDGVVTGFEFGDALTGGEGVGGTYIQPATNAQKLYNQYIENGIKLLDQKAAKEDEAADLNNTMTGEYVMGMVAAKREVADIDRNTIANLNPASQLYWSVLNEAQKNGVKLTQTQKDTLAETSMEVSSLAVETELLSGIQSTLSNGFQSMFQSMIDGTKSFKDSMKDLAKSVLADLAAMFMKAAALKMMLAMFPGMGDGSGGFKSLFGSGDRYGGIRSAPGYGGGGVAQGPNSGYMAKLHGTEAIVPLGNDRSIPVDIRGGGGNTVNVSINMQGGQSQTSVSGGGDMAQLGKSIGGLVQQHLQTEMRPGGLLNRQGAKGRAG